MGLLSHINCQWPLLALWLAPHAGQRECQALYRGHSDLFIFHKYRPMLVTVFSFPLIFYSSPMDSQYGGLGYTGM